MSLRNKLIDIAIRNNDRELYEYAITASFKAIQKRSLFINAELDEHPIMGDFDENGNTI